MNTAKAMLLATMTGPAATSRRRHKSMLALTRHGRHTQAETTSLRRRSSKRSLHTQAMPHRTHRRTTSRTTILIRRTILPIIRPPVPTIHTSRLVVPTAKAMPHLVHLTLTILSRVILATLHLKTWLLPASGSTRCAKTPGTHVVAETPATGIQAM